MSEALSYCEECDLRFIRCEHDAQGRRRIYRCPICETDSVDHTGAKQHDDSRTHPGHRGDVADATDQ